MWSIVIQFIHRGITLIAAWETGWKGRDDGKTTREMTLTIIQAIKKDKALQREVLVDRLREEMRQFGFGV